jgi:low affinity Fe/Cu permease
MADEPLSRAGPRMAGGRVGLRGPLRGEEARQVEGRGEAGGQAGWQQPKARAATPCPTVSNRSSCETAWMWVKRLKRLLTNIGTWLSRPWFAGGVALYLLFWIIFDPGSFNWHAIATIATLFMTLFIQRSEHRDTQAIHAKLDELLRVHGDARNRLTTLDDKEPEQVEAFRDEARASK